MLHPGECDGLRWEEYRERYAFDMRAEPERPARTRTVSRLQGEWRSLVGRGAVAQWPHCGLELPRAGLLKLRKGQEAALLGQLLDRVPLLQAATCPDSGGGVLLDIGVGEIIRGTTKV